jgi:putative MATE family efflux protein
MPASSQFLKAPIGYVLLRTSLANSLGILAAASFSLVDTFFISQLGTQALTAINLTWPVTLTLASMVLGFASALTHTLGRALGAQNKAQAHDLLVHGLQMALCIGTLLAVALALLSPWLWSLLGAPESVLPYMTEFMDIWCLYLPCLACLMVLQQALRALDAAKLSAMITCMAALLNIALDAWFVLGLDLGVAGAAYASVFACLCSCGAYVMMLQKRFDLLHPTRLFAFNLPKLCATWQQLRSTTYSTSFTLLLNPITQTMVLGVIARINPNAVAAYGTGLQLQSLFILGINATAASLMPFIAQNLGADQHTRAYQGLKKAIYGIWVWQLVLCVPLYYFSTAIAELFSQNPEVVEWLSFYLHWLPLGFAPLGTLIFVAQAFIAYNKPSYALGINAFRLLGLTLPLTWLGVQLFGIAGAFTAPLCANVIMGCSSYMFLRRQLKPDS